MTVDMSECTCVKLIGKGAFYNDKNLRLFMIGTETPPKLDSSGYYITFDGISSYAVLKVPSGCVDNYKNASEWNRFASITALDE